ncbi:hypothetical protein Acy02nite_70830 [Actinoplanes cyaneus]|uniref:Uncharacterized protein n=3 Tax=Actinoplanes cyaneus TaxID=52696 RepID=A0A919M7W4_9ACTN|nr:hypothetical protein [Actinoplanes cyaneus]GID69202.1 hypothetical protein Acy02nite_70830 [Actinoplanes cyaneus]
MIAMRTAELLAMLDPLPYGKRMRHLAAWARTAPDRAEVCAELSAGDAYERRLALFAALAAGDTVAVDAATGDPLPALRSIAIAATLRAGRLTVAVAELAAVDRRHIHRTLRAAPDPAVADALIGKIRERFGDDEAAAILPACGASTVRTLLPGLAHAANLVLVARRHPRVFTDYATGVLAAAAPDARARQWSELAPAVLALDPKHALDLLEHYAPESTLPGRLTAYGPLAKHFPARVAALLTAPARADWLRTAALPSGLLRRLGTLPDDELAPLARRLAALAPLLRALPPARRAAIYRASLAEVDAERHIPAYEVLDLLPAADRAREARRLLSLDRVRADEAWTLDLSAYLDWPEAAASQETALRSGDAGERARAYTRLVEAAGRSRDPRVVATLVTRLTRLRNEQDPVRSAALTALAGVSRLFTAPAATELTTVTADALEARDSSAATTGALSRLAAATLQHHVDVPELRDWALLTIDLLSTAATVPTLHRFDRVLRRGQETMVFDRLRPWVEANLDRGRYAPLFALAAALGKRAWRLPGLQELLGRATGPDTLPWVAEAAITRWLQDPRSRDERVGAVLAADPSAVLLGPVWDVIADRRTDLLDEVLYRRPVGRFADRRAVWAPRWVRHPERWLPRQLSALAALHARTLDDPGADPGPRVAALMSVAPLGATGHALVLKYVDAPEVPLAEAALGALVRTEQPGLALPVLLAHAGDDRARVALYAAARAAKFLPPGTLVPPVTALLDPAAAVKVTSRKEAVRILARYGPAGTMDRLLDAYQAVGQHRDVRAAITGAVRQRLDAEASWAVLDRAVAASREERRAVLSTSPYAVPAPHRSRYAALIVAAARADDREVRTLALGQLATWAPWAGDLTDLVVDRLTDLDERLVTIAVAGLLRATGGHALGPALTRLLAVTDSDPRPGDDLPARRRIETLVDGAGVLSGSWPPATDRSPLVTAARGLVVRPGYRAVALAALVRLGRFDNLTEIADQCTGRPAIAVRLADLIGARMRGDQALTEPAFLHDLIERLIRRGDLAAGLFATRLIRAGAGYGWAGRWRDLVLALRTHPDPDVRDDALAISMS